MKAKVLKLTAKTALSAVCTFCFIALCWTQFKEYFGGDTSITQAWQFQEKRRLPILAFCPYEGFKVSEKINILNYPWNILIFKAVINLSNASQDDITMSVELMLDEEKYNSMARYPNVSFRGRAYTDYSFFKNKTFDQWQVQTYYHGICQVIWLIFNF